jgi:hypothetical protein
MIDKQASSILHRTIEKGGSGSKRLQNVKFESAPHTPKRTKHSAGKNKDLIAAGGVDLPSIL